MKLTELSKVKNPSVKEELEESTLYMTNEKYLQLAIILK